MLLQHHGHQHCHAMMPAPLLMMSPLSAHLDASELLQLFEPKLQLSYAQEVSGAIFKACWGRRQQPPRIFCCSIQHRAATKVDLVQHRQRLLPRYEGTKASWKSCKIAGGA
jgi:hypothetical protein